MAKFSYVNKEKQLVEFSFNDIKPENPINDFIQNNSVDDSYDFDELTTNGIYLFQNISKINNEVKHRPAALAGSGQLFFFSEEPSKANRIVFQLVFADSDESKLHYRRGMANSAGLQFEEWQSTSRSTEAISNFAISKVSPASIVGGSWIKNSSVPASMVWEHSGVSTYVDGQTSGMNVLLNLETFALSASQEVYIKESGAFQKMTLGIGCGGTGSTTAEGARNALGAASQTDLNSLRDSVSKIHISNGTLIDTSIPEVHLYETVQNNKIAIIGGWLSINTNAWTTIAKNLPPAKIKVFTTVPVDAISNINNAIKFRITERGELDARLVRPNTSGQILYADFFITYITV